MIDRRARVDEHVLAITRHHAQLRRRLEERVEALVAAVGGGRRTDEPLAALREFLLGEVLPYSEVEERTLYRAAASSGRTDLPFAAMEEEHRALAALADQLRGDTDALAVAMTAQWIATLFAGHIAKEKELLLPMLIGCRADLSLDEADSWRRLTVPSAEPVPRAT